MAASFGKRPTLPSFGIRPDRTRQFPRDDPAAGDEMIDVHAHAVFEMVMGAAGVHGPEHFDVHVHDEGSMRLLVEKAGGDRLVFGTNFGGRDSGATSGAGGHMPLDILAPTLDANARRLLRLPEPGHERSPAMNAARP